MNKPAVNKAFTAMVLMIEQLIKTEGLRTSQLNRLGTTLELLRKAIYDERK